MKQLEGKKQMTSRRRKVCVLVVLMILIAAGVGTYLYFRERDYPFTVSKETTFLLGPLNPDGTVNYVAALNEMLSEGVTPENNAAVLLVQALGPEVIPEGTRRETLDLLQIRSFPENESYFVDPWSYLQPRAPTGVREPAAGTEGSEELSTFEGTFWETQTENLENAQSAPWSADDFPELAEWVNVNEKPLVLVVAACERPRYYMPLVSRSRPPLVADSFFSSLGRHISLAQALAARSMLRVNTGDIQGACADALTCHRLARLVGEGPTLIDRLVGIRLESMACDTDLVFAASGKLSAAQGKKFITELQRMGPLPGLVDAVNHGQRFFVLDAVAVLYRRKVFGVGRGDDLAPNVSVDWNKAMRTINSWCDRAVAAMRETTFLERQNDFSLLGQDLAALQKEFKSSGKRSRGWFGKFTEELAEKRARERTYRRAPGKALLAELFPSLERVIELQDRAIMRFRLAQVALALAGYKAQRGEYPETLSELTPEYFKKIPEDLFVNKPPKYKRVNGGYLLYSVGANMKDDGGKKGDPQGRAGDLIIRAE